MRKTASPTRRGSRLVATTVRPWQERTSCSIVRAAPSMTCSQLSTMSSIDLERSAETIESRSGRPGISATLSTAEIACGRSDASRSAASSTSQMPSRNRSRRRSPSSIAILVLPTPPTPVIVTSLCSRINSRRRTISALRPTNRVSECGRFERSTGAWRLRRSAPERSFPGKGRLGRGGLELQAIRSVEFERTDQKGERGALRGRAVAALKRTDRFGADSCAPGQ